MHVISANLQFVLDPPDFDGMLVLLDINGHGMEMMDFETLVGNGVLMLDLMVVISF